VNVVYCLGHARQVHGGKLAFEHEGRQTADLVNTVAGIHCPNPRISKSRPP
jgi:hypothetical protein